MIFGSDNRAWVDVVMVHWRMAVGLLSITTALWASAHAILYRRDPRASLWWATLVWMLPIVGAVFYLLFGINRIERKVSRMMRKRGSMPAVGTRSIVTPPCDRGAIHPAHLRSLARLVDGVADEPLTDGNQVDPLTNGDSAYPAMLEAIEHATSTIGLSTYIFNNDRAGRRFIHALAGAVRRGVDVRVLIDDVGSGFFWSSVHHALSSAKVPVAYFHQSRVPYRMAYVNLRDHRKILTVDGTVAFTGGMNIDENHWRSLGVASPITDLHFRLKGPVVEHVQDVFRDDWHFATDELLPEARWFSRSTGAGPVLARGIPDGPDEHIDRTRWIVQAALANARSHVRIVTPYFIPDGSLITAINLAAMSGVEVDLILPSTNDLALVKWASSAFLWQVLERGCRVWLTPPPFDHTKLMVVDSAWALFGSSNWDPRSLRLNFEFNVEAYDEDLGRRLDAVTQEKMNSARRITLADVDARSFPVRLRDGIARLAAPML